MRGKNKTQNDIPCERDTKKTRNVAKNKQTNKQTNWMIDKDVTSCKQRSI